VGDMTIHNIGKEFYSLIEKYENGEISQEQFAESLMKVEENKIEKCGNAICYLNMLKHNIENMKAEEKRINTMRKSLESRTKNIEETFTYVLSRMGDKEIITRYGIMKIRKNPPSVVIDDETKIPAKYTSQKITITPDKTKIKKAIQNGENVEGARLEQGEKLVY